MTEPILSTDELEKFTTGYRREILFHLRQLIEAGERVSVIFDEGRESLLTVLLAVDETDDRLIFDWGGSEELNRKLLQSPRNIFVCMPHGVRNQFVTGRAFATEHQGRRAFTTPLPSHYTRLQRREFFRLVLPLSHRPLCLVKTADGDTLELPVLDISIGGLVVETSSANLPFEIGQRLPGSLIALLEGSRLEVELEVRNLAIVARGSRSFGRIGCRFIDLSHAAEHLLQRFITDVQREERARLGI